MKEVRQATNTCQTLSGSHSLSERAADWSTSFAWLREVEKVADDGFHEFVSFTFKALAEWGWAGIKWLFQPWIKSVTCIRGGIMVLKSVGPFLKNIFFTILSSVRALCNNVLPVGLFWLEHSVFWETSNHYCTSCVPCRVRGWLETIQALGIICKVIHSFCSKSFSALGSGPDIQSLDMQME